MVNLENKETILVARTLKVVKTDTDRLKAVSVFCGKNDTRKVVNGVCVQKGRLCATNGKQGVRLKTDTSAIIAEHCCNFELPESDLIVMKGGDVHNMRFPDIDRAYPDVSLFDHCFVVDSSTLAARLRGIKKFNTQKPKDELFFVDFIFDGMDFSKRFGVDYLLKLSETFQRFGYKKFKLYLSKHMDVLRADSFDGMLDAIIMGVRKYDDKITDFKTVRNEVLFT